MSVLQVLQYLLEYTTDCKSPCNLSSGFIGSPACIIPAVMEIVQTGEHKTAEQAPRALGGA